jgi:transposase-like protein
MRKSRYAEEQIIKVLNEVEAGAKVQDVTRKLGMAETTLYRWSGRPATSSRATAASRPAGTRSRRTWTA